jgi:sugar transferase (PEP-CTERM/EpsH1 system associated)
MPAAAVHAEKRPLLMHVVYRFSVGGLENGLVNLINHLPPQLGRHCVLSLTTVDPLFSKRVTAPGVEFVAINKPPGQTALVLPKVYQHIRGRRPALVHTRNIAALECQLAAWLARVPVRVHGEHGWDVNDLHGTNRGRLYLRRLLKPFVHHQIALSNKTASYLTEKVGIDTARVTEVCNGVDVGCFSPPEPDAPAYLPARQSVPLGRAASFPEGAPAGWTRSSGQFVIGTVGRLAAVKNQRLLCEAFLLLQGRDPTFRERGRLLLVGDGPDLPLLKSKLHSALPGSVWFCGEQQDVSRWLSAMDLFVLPSLAEGISNSVLEAMACARPVIATSVGGNDELVESGCTGMLLESLNAAELADAIQRYFRQPALCRSHGRKGRERAINRFSIETMVSAYASLYSRLLSGSPGIPVRPDLIPDPDSGRTAAKERPSCAG